MTEEESASTPRRRSRAASTGQRAASTTRRQRIGGAELVETLNEMVSQLIKENRNLKRQLAKLGGIAPAQAAGAADRTLRSLHRKVQRAVGAAPASRRRTTSASATPRRRSPRRNSAAPAD